MGSREKVLLVLRHRARAMGTSSFLNFGNNCIGTRKRMEGKVGAAFATSGDPTGGKETTMISIIQCLLIYGMVIVGDPMSATGHYGTACAGAPDDATADNAAKLGARVAEVAKRLSSQGRGTER